MSEPPGGEFPRDEPPLDRPDGGTFLTGSLLVATPLTGPPFEKAVVLVLHHDEEGAHGLVLNQPLDADVAVVLPDWQPFASEPGSLFHGGPVGRDTAMGIISVPGHDAGDPPLGTQVLFGGLGLLDLDAPAPLVVPELGGLRIFVGYAGWGPGQLDAEVVQGAWYVVPREPRDPFEPDTSDLWAQVLRRQRNELSLVTTWTSTPELN